MPAKNLICGIEAINHGADAVYIGASAFGARAAAGNSLNDIQSLVDYAHLYSAKVFVTINTILTNQELEEAEKLIRQCYQTGVDAIIIQDVGILELDLPPIVLHASTQMNNTSAEKVKFLQQQGFSRVVLARELSLNQISEIHSQTNIELEAFVHGSLCVSYSGQCYMSQYMNGRSANRGACAQCCRLPFTLKDKNGKILSENKHLLSLKDLNRSAYLKEMIDAGVSSFKVEGRLKDLDYIKNIASYYRQKLDLILSSDSENMERASVGKSYFFFEPDPKKTFSRGNTDYFLKERQSHMVQLHTPKSTGEFVGIIEEVKERYFTVSQAKSLSNGDGLCLIDAQDEFIGFRINTVEGNRVYPSQMPYLKKGLELYRNHDHEFQKILSRKTAERKIGLDVLMEETPNGFKVTLTEERVISISLEIETEKTISENFLNPLAEIQTQFSKLGNTIFELRNADANFSNSWFLPRSLLTQWKRDSVELLLAKIKESYCVAVKENKKEKSDLLQNKNLNYSYNVMNDRAKDFYLNLGAKNVMPSFEQHPEKDADLMTCKYCIKYELGFCPQLNNDFKIAEPLYLVHNSFQFKLEFDCKECLMRVKTDNI
jgi:putative protease